MKVTIPKTLDAEPPDECDSGAVTQIADHDRKKEECKAAGVAVEPQVSRRHHHRRQRNQLIHAAAFEQHRKRQ